MKDRLPWLAVLAAALAFIAAPAWAADDDGGNSSTVASLTGEGFLTSEIPFNPGTLEVEGTCNLLGPSTFTFTATGLAAGPYPGTFSESGTIELDGISATSFTASFQIDSPSGTVTGTKTLTAPSALGLCGTAAFPTGGADSLRFEGTVSYTATIPTPTGPATDNGTAFVNLGDTQIRGVAGFNGFVFSETFTSTSLELPPCEDDNDEQGDDPSCDEGEGGD